LTSPFVSFLPPRRAPSRLRLGLEHDRAVRLDPVAAGEARLTVGVDALPRELPVRVPGVLLEQVLGHGLAGLIAAIEGDRVHIGLEAAQQLDGLGREAEPLVLGEVLARAVLERQRLHDHGDPSTSAIATAVFAPYFVVRCPKRPRKSSTLASNDARTSSTPAARSVHQRGRVIHAGYRNVRIAVASSTPRPR